ncbi:MAG: ankyrin repeat domain-containing protein [Bacteroidales bacterium]|nr:ankyrin repeat domain-containing protein [Bacteroidales bacterium]
MKYIYFIGICLLLFLSGCKEKQANNGNQEPAPGAVPSPAAISCQVREQSLLDAALNGQFEAIENLIAENVNVNAADPDGRSALMLASFNGHSGIVALLINKGAVVDLVDGFGRTALHYASTGPFLPAVEFLLKKGSDPNMVDSEEHFTPLMFAAAEGYIDVVRILLEYHADPSLKDIDGDTAETFARQNGHDEVAELLKSKSTQ